MITQQNDLSHLYEYRVSNGRELVTVPSRYAASKKMVSWANSGHNHHDFVAEHKVNGEWQHDPTVFELFDRHSYQQSLKNASRAKSRKSADPLKQALRNLGQAVRLANAASSLSEAHIEAVRFACEEFIQELVQEPVDDEE